MKYTMICNCTFGDRKNLYTQKIFDSFEDMAECYHNYILSQPFHIFEITDPHFLGTLDGSIINLDKAVFEFIENLPCQKLSKV